MSSTPPPACAALTIALTMAREKSTDAPESEAPEMRLLPTSMRLDTSTLASLKFMALLLPPVVRMSWMAS